jgi:hypothetical protein
MSSNDPDRSSFGGEQASGVPVAPVANGGRDRGVDRIPDERVREAIGGLRRENGCGREAPALVGRLALSHACERRCPCDRGLPSQDRHHLGEASSARIEAAEAGVHEPPDALRDEGRHLGWQSVVVGQAFAAEVPQQLGDEEGVSAGRRAELTPEGTEARIEPDHVEQLSHRLLAERGRLELDRAPVCQEEAAQLLQARTFARSEGQSQGDGHDHDAAAEVVEEAKRSIVRPLRVVDGDEQRRLLRRVQREPVEAMDGRERVARTRILGVLAPFEEVRNRSSRAVEEDISTIVASVNEPLEQRDRDPAGVLSLQLTPCRTERLHAAVAGVRRSLAEEGRLPDPGLAGDHDEPSPTSARAVDRGPKGSQLGPAFEDRELQRSARGGIRHAWSDPARGALTAAPAGFRRTCSSPCNFWGPHPSAPESTEP